MHRIELPPMPWPGVDAGLMFIGDRMGGQDSRLPPPIRRVHQSRSARAVAVDLLADRGCWVDVIGKGPVGEPLWPPGFVGSLSHTESHVAAVVAAASTCLALGVDVESDAPLPQDTDRLILCDEERDWLRQCGRPFPGIDRAVFCTKECVHKAIHPLRGAWLDFQEVWIELDVANGRFWPHPVSSQARKAFDGLRAEGTLLRIEGQLLAVLALFEA